LVVVANGISSDSVLFYTPDALQIVNLGDQALVSWPLSAMNAVLESTTDLVDGGWTPVTNAMSVLGTDFAITNSLSDDRVFFRLHGQ
jgi:hypothetical protein